MWQCYRGWKLCALRIIRSFCSGIVSSRKLTYVHLSSKTFSKDVKNLSILTEKKKNEYKYLDSIVQSNPFKTILTIEITQAETSMVVWSIPRFLSRVLVNWLSAGGTFKRCLRILFFLWIRTTLGHFTNRCKSLFGGKAPPIPNCFVRFSNSGFTTFS